MAVRGRTIVIAFIVVIVLSAGLFVEISILSPNRKLRNMKWLETASVEEQRDVCHKVLRWKFGNRHDAAMLLSSCGDSSSVSYLINALRSESPTKPGQGID